MAAQLKQLVTKKQRLRRDQAEKFREAIKLIEDDLGLPVDLMCGVYQYIEKLTASKRKWTFVMISPEQNSNVVNYLLENSSRPLVAVKLWALCFNYLRTDTGEILLRRDEIADKIGHSAAHVSLIMTELEACGAIIRRREKQGGMKGRGLVRYFMNPNVATHTAGAQRDAAQEAAPPLLTLMQGGKVAP